MIGWVTGLLFACSGSPPATGGGGGAAPVAAPERDRGGGERGGDRERDRGDRGDRDRRARQDGDPPNVLLVILDDVGVDRVAAYGEQRSAPATPTLSGLASEGVLFRNAWAHPYCSPTRAAIQTGRYAGRLGLGYVVFPNGDGPELQESEVTIPEMLATAKTPWDTSYVGKWHLGTSRSGPAATHPGRQGYAWYAATLDNLHGKSEGGEEEDEDDADGKGGYFHYKKNTNGTVRVSDTYATTDSADDAIERMRKMGEPWFLTLAFHAAHTPLHTPPAALLPSPLPENASRADRYDAMLQAADHELGRVLRSMSKAQREQTVVFVIGDNGTAEVGVRPPLDPRRAKGTLYELGVNVPLIVSGPGVARGRESDALVHAVDLFPTIADLAKVDVATLKNPLDGRSLLPVLADPTQPVHPFVMSEQFQPNGPGPYGHYSVAIRGPRYKLLIETNRAGKTEEHLFDVASNPDDGPDLLARKQVPEEAKQALATLRAELEPHRRDAR